ncbi:uncharacterized protein ATNIH1004_011281 [Aspergillus tanneri]|uniref:Clr5 domain-containing protein n=1 Tax=Aspergillus tanneri TaxID=1220188 RepID=A0A5M9MHC2_9EURO|nr:uncharacterized protein ATNIH1004_011281 [Aspergillus tanneri]KAA8642337.1 hypothetical protein ATNIH1004_011281 [Aspergillus tanneri]
MSRGKQYKDRLAAWHIRKNIKTKAVQSMIRKQQKRLAQGKQTAFRDSIGSNRITGSISRYGTEWDKRPRDKYRAESPEPRTPSDMSCYTPEPDDRGATLTPLPEIQSEHREITLSCTKLNDVHPMPYKESSIIKLYR